MKATSVTATRFVAFHLLLFLTCQSASQAADMSVVPLLNGERNDSLNLWGGPINGGSTAGFSKQSSIVHTGSGAYRVDLGNADPFEFFFTASSALSGNQLYRQDRDLTQYQTFEGYVRNDAGNPLTFTLEVKDYRDSLSHRARRSFTIPAGAWTKIEAPLDLGSGWQVDGSPDLSRTYVVAFGVDESMGQLNGSLYLDDFNLIEKGPSVDAATAPIHDVVEKLAHRQFSALWTSRNKTSGLIPNSSDNVAIGALNTTTGVVWNLPSAIRRGWVSQAEADAYMGQLVTTLNSNRNQTTYLPTRFLDLVNGDPVTDHEESSIDAAFIALALHNYKSQPGASPTIVSQIDTLENRFNFAAFMTGGAALQAYFQPTGSFGCCTYSGYTNEHKVIALAAEASDAHHVALASQWNKDVGRSLASLVNPQQNHLVYSYDTAYRAPFVQALLNLFVDVSDRGADNYPTRNLARNPWLNFVRYESEVAAKLDQLGRDHFMQPDAGAGAGTYQPWNLYNNFGQPNLFQPWSVAFMLMAGAPGAEDALRFMLDNGLVNGLDGPFGLADSAQWATGAVNPTDVPSFADNWNVTLSLMALMNYLDGDQSAARLFADLPEIDAALDTVFVAGDYTGNGTVDIADYNYWKSTFGSRTLLAADGNNNGIIDAGDYTVWRDHFAGGAGGGAAAVPEPATGIFISGIAAGLSAIRIKRFSRRFRTHGPALTSGGRPADDRRSRRENGICWVGGEKLYESACNPCFAWL